MSDRGRWGLESMADALLGSNRIRRAAERMRSRQVMQVLAMPQSLVRTPWDGPPVRPGDELILDTTSGKLKSRIWGVRPIRKVTTAMVVAAGDGYVDIRVPFRRGRHEWPASS